MRTDPSLSRARLALSGVVAALLGVAIGHLLAALTTISASPVLAVGYAVIDRTPSGLKDWAIRHFGTNDKPILLCTIAVLTLLWAALAGAVGRAPWRSAAAFAALSAVAAAAATTRPGAGPSWLLPTVATFVVTLASFAFLRRLSRTAPSADGRSGASRRTFLTAGAGLAGLGAAAMVAGQKLSAATSTARLALPKALRKAAPIPAGLEREAPGITRLRTSNASFYRVDTALTVPQVDRDAWKLVIDGDVERRIELSYDDIAAMKLIEKNITMTCVSNEVGGEYVGGATWLGVPVRELLALAGVREPDRPDAQVLSTSFDGFTASTPLSALLDDREALLAIGMNGEALPREHGFPARVVVPGLYGMLGSTKWITRMKVTTRAEKAYWTKRGWADDASIKPSARIDQPQSLASLKRGEVKIGGIAWAQRRGVRAVEVRIDDGPWHRASLGPEVNEDYWRQWIFRWQAGDDAVGRHTVSARVIDGDGRTQTNERAAPLPDGSSGIQEQVFFVV